MKLRIKKIIIPMALLLFIGAGCTRSDKDLAIGFLMDWAVSQGIINEDGSPTWSTLARSTLGTSTGDPQTDAAIDAGVVAKSIKDSDEQIDQADQALANDQPDREKALDHLNQAAKIRPDDWYIRNQRATVLAETGKDPQKDTTRADKSCDKLADRSQRRCLERVYANRAEFVEASIARQIRSRGKVKCTTYELQAATYKELGRYRLTPFEVGDTYFDAYQRAQTQASQPGVTCAP
ncbi:hypothetical protein MYX06_04090 [Patescibacteria group bacterium AH-259-L05]|nr:hypothetical protein [Patescibacteria group bacterium AH-259-L05]